MSPAEQGEQEGAPGHAHPVPASMPGQAPAHADPARPRFSESQAAKLCGVSRSTIQRARKRGDIPGVERVRSGWSLPLEGLLVAGFKPESGAGTPLGAPMPAGTPGRAPAHAHPARPVEEELGPEKHLDSKVHRLELELEQARAEARVMRAERDAAQAVADERQRIIALLEAPKNVPPATDAVQQDGSSPDPSPSVSTVEPATTPKRSRWMRAAERWLS